LTINKSQRTGVSTFASRTSPSTRQSFVKELSKPTQRKIVFKNSPTLHKKLKNATHNLTDNDTEPQKRTWLTETVDKINNWQRYFFLWRGLMLL
jgi:hypothetical protein